MTLSHRLRMFILQRRANMLIRKLRLDSAYLNRPHVQREHMISYPVTQEGESSIGPLYVACVIVFIGLVAYLNYFYQEQEPQTRACTPIVRKMT